MEGRVQLLHIIKDFRFCAALTAAESGGWHHTWQLSFTREGGISRWKSLQEYTETKVKFSFTHVLRIRPEEEKAQQTNNSESDTL